jgi:hypothetical protein
VAYGTYSGPSNFAKFMQVAGLNFHACDRVTKLCECTSQTDCITALTVCFTVVSVLQYSDYVDP